MDHWLGRMLATLDVQILNYEVKKSDYDITGPPMKYKDQNEIFNELSKIWKRSALLMKQICEANNIQYFHFLQPNQYLTGSKNLNEVELKQAYHEKHPYKKGVEIGYPYLMKAGRELVKEGVNFYDLTQIFTKEKDQIYVDPCCHYNKKGYQIVNSEIAKLISKKFEGLEELEK